MWAAKNIFIALVVLWCMITLSGSIRKYKESKENAELAEVIARVLLIFGGTIILISGIASLM